GSIQNLLSVLFPPFEATAPTLLSQLFQVIDNHYQGDALRCLLDFLVPAKHILDTVQQAACAPYSGVLFVYEGWPLCLCDQVVVHLAPIDPVLLQPGDFYLQVAPFCDQSARIVVCSLLEDEDLLEELVEETPIPETSYPCIFSLDWLDELNNGRQGTPLSRCLLATEQGVVRLPWERVAVPEFADRPHSARSSMASAPGRDRTGRAVVELYGDHPGWRTAVTSQEIFQMLLYFHSITTEIRDSGMTLVFDARKTNPQPHLYKALMTLQEQRPQAVSSLVMLVDKENNFRPERCPGIQQTDIVTSVKSLLKLVEVSQLSSHLDGTLSRGNVDWKELHQKLFPFVYDLHVASSLLLRAISKLEEPRRTDTVQQGVQQCMIDQRTLMRDVLEDSRLVSLQREGGAILARLRKQSDLKYPHCEDFDAVDSVTGLYNHVEEQAHVLVQRSNVSLEHLEYLLQLREMEGHFTQQWFNEEGEHHLLEAESVEDSGDRMEQILNIFTGFLIEANQDRRHHAMSLVSEAERLQQRGISYPETEAFRDFVCTFKSGLEDFLCRAEACGRELQIMVNVCDFCEQLQAFHDRFQQFSPEKFQEVKAQASFLQGSRGMRVWNFAWLRSQEARQQLQERMQNVDEVYHQQPDSSSWCERLQRVMEELVFTEREYVRSLGYILTHYLPLMDRLDIPQDLRGKRGVIFGNLEKLYDFHSHYFLPELEACPREPAMMARCFLRHSESFGLYALYSKNKPQSDALILHDLTSSERERERAEIQAAAALIRFQMRHGNDLLTMDAIQDCDVNLKEQGQLIRQDEFTVFFRKKKCVRRVFLFEDLILFSKTKKTDIGNDVYIYKQSFKTNDIGMTHNSAMSALCFEIWFRRRKSEDTYTLRASSVEVKKAWTTDLERILWDQAAHSRMRMQERVFMGMDRKPFMDIQPSDAAICDRAVSYPRPHSIGSGSTTSTTLSQSSSSSGRGSLPPAGHPGNL
uniref:Uncharacterized LOC101485553 n=1 Tax=Maylandia zebra TaxID=106582 RepID=A0A3P9CZL9_9CICH